MEPSVLAALLGLGLAFVSQTVLGWMKLTALETKLRDCCDDIKELQVIHPRKTNPGGRSHLESDEHLHQLGD